MRTSFCHWYLNGYRWITMKWCKCFAKNRTFVAFLAHLNPTQVCKSLPKFSTNQEPISAEQEKGEGGGYNWKGQWDSIEVSSGESYYIPIRSVLLLKCTCIHTQQKTFQLKSEMKKFLKIFCNSFNNPRNHDL